MPGGVDPSEREDGGRRRRSSSERQQRTPRRGRKWSGEGQQGGRLGAGFDLKKPGARRALPRRASWRRFHLDRERARDAGGWGRCRQAGPVRQHLGTGGCLVRCRRGWAAAVGLATPRRAAGLRCRAGRGCWAESGGWAERGRGEEGERAAEERAYRPKPRKGVERKKFPFSFYK